ncbi:hypothetical protein H0H81_010553 [Sphagnurus paluster]|uniref:RING-type domain-containing protein n=1 Tax=Sphagnurus paluster TaxID=117069 RepID=A0A9P7K6E4_9AGAR|nr:hypothetical protein H0H81_010553 [Sphagnurus paluster]
MDPHNIANALNNLFRAFAPQQAAGVDPDMPALEPISAPAQAPDEPGPSNNGTANNDDDSMPDLQPVSDSSDDEDAQEVEMQAVQDDDNDSAWTDESGSASSLPPLEPISAPRPNRRARVEDDEDEDRDRRHPSQRVGNPINANAAPPAPQPIPVAAPAPVPPTNPLPAPRIRTTINIPGVVRVPATAPPNAPPPPAAIFGGFAITFDLNGGRSIRPLPPIVVPAGAGPAAPPLDPANANGDFDPADAPDGPQAFAAFRDFLSLFGMGGAEREVEDPERAKRLVDALEEVPVGLVRRLEALGAVAERDGVKDEGGLGEVGCAICWDKLLDGEGGFGADQEHKHDHPDGTHADAETTTADVKDKAEHPKIVSLPCAHVFHAACLIPWFSRPRQTTCPTCRFNIDPENLSATPRTPSRPAPPNAAAPEPPAPADQPIGVGEDAAPWPPVPDDAGEQTDEERAAQDEAMQRIRRDFMDRLGLLRAQRQRDRAAANENANGGVADNDTGGELNTFPQGEADDAMDVVVDGLGGDANANANATVDEQGPAAPGDAPAATAAPQPGALPAAGLPPFNPPGGGFFTIGFDVFIRGPPIHIPNPDANADPGAPPANPAGENGPNPGAEAGEHPMDIDEEFEGIFGSEDGMDMDGGGLRGGPVPWLPAGVIVPPWIRPGGGAGGIGGLFGGALGGFAGAGQGAGPGGLRGGPGNVQFVTGTGRTVDEAFAALFGGRQQAPAPAPAPAATDPPVPPPAATGPVENADATAGQTQPQAEAPEQGQGQPRRPERAQSLFSTLFGQLGAQMQAQPQDTQAQAPPANDNLPPPPPPPAPTANPEQQDGPPTAPATPPTNPTPGVPPNAQPRAAPVPLPPMFGGFGGGGNFGWGFMPGPRARREKKPWTLPPAPGPTLRQRVERREREAGLRCFDVSCGVGPSDEEPVAALSEAARRQLSIRAIGQDGAAVQAEGEGGGGEGEKGVVSVCAHTFHPACLVSAARVASMGEEAPVGADEMVEVACSVCRGVGNVHKGDWDEGVQALA